MNCFKCKRELDWENIHWEIELSLNSFKKNALEIQRKFACEDCKKEVFG